MPGKSLTEIKAAELAEIRERMAAEKADRARLDVRPHGLWWHLGQWTRRFKRIKKALSALATAITAVGTVLAAVNGIQNPGARVAACPPPSCLPRRGERLSPPIESRSPRPPSREVQ